MKSNGSPLTVTLNNANNFFRLNKQNKYLPILQYNFLESRLDDLVLITPKTTSLNVTFSYAPIGIGKLRLLLHLEQSMKQLYNLGFTEKDVDSVKDLFAESNLYVLCLTVLIGGVHVSINIIFLNNDYFLNFLFLNES